jgi:hypothetical protein
VDYDQRNGGWNTCFNRVLAVSLHASRSECNFESILYHQFVAGSVFSAGDNCSAERTNERLHGNAMIRFSASTENDIPQIAEWINADIYHKDQGHPEWWLTGNGILAFCLMDDRGPLTYVRLDDEGEYVRINTQFAPEEVVSKRRLVVGMLDCLKVLRDTYKGKKGFIFQSTSPSLIAFMEKYEGFKSIGGEDYRADFEETT